jgi:hypothetical protein
MSGSCLTIERKPFANVIPCLACICICLTPGIAYSTGSSSVMIELFLSFNDAIKEYKVEVLPEPVGPVTRIIP